MRLMDSHNAEVGGSSPPIATNKINNLAIHTSGGHPPDST